MTGRKPFEPADGVEARWRRLYDLVQSKEPGDQITYGEVQELLDCDRPAALQAMDQARDKLLRNHQLAVRTVERFGWIKMTPAEHIAVVEKRRVKAGRQIERGIVAITATQHHREQLSPFDRERLDREQAIHVRHAELVGRRRRSLAELTDLAQKRGEIAS